MGTRTAYIGLGSNLGDRVGSLETAVKMLSALERSRLTAVSSVYETSAVGFAGGPFLNAVALIQTELGPLNLLDRLLNIESLMGRRRDPEDAGSRVIDLDILLYGTEVTEEKGLVLPHPRMLDRRFVMEPLAELAPDLRIPSGGTTASEAAAELRIKHPEQEVKRLGTLEEVKGKGSGIRDLGSGT